MTLGQGQGQGQGLGQGRPREGEGMFAARSSSRVQQLHHPRSPVRLAWLLFPRRTCPWASERVLATVGLGTPQDPILLGNQAVFQDLHGIWPMALSKLNPTRGLIKTS